MTFKEGALGAPLRLATLSSLYSSENNGVKPFQNAWREKLLGGFSKTLHIVGRNYAETLPLAATVAG
jgi:hypothetical protein